MIQQIHRIYGIYPNLHTGFYWWTEKSEQVWMGASLQEEQRQLRVILFPGHQPVGLDMTLPLPFMIAFQLVRAILFTLSQLLTK